MQAFAVGYTMMASELWFLSRWRPVGRLVYVACRGRCPPASSVKPFQLPNTTGLARPARRVT